MKELLIFGVSGSLGKKASSVFVEKDYDNIYLIGSSEPDILNRKNNVRFIKTKDLSIEENVRKVFNQIPPVKENEYFLFSTIGGFTGGKTFWEIELEEFQKQLSINLIINFLIAKYFCLLIRETSGGSICFTSAISSFKNEANKGAYGLTKNALNYFIETLAVEGKQINLSVNAVAPNIIDTEENRGWISDLSLLTTGEQIAEVVHSIFQNYKGISGNIFKMPFSL